jgi:peptide/nickel transport system ATP-binding protein
VPEPLLKVAGLKTHFFTDEGVVKAVDGVDFAIHKGKILGLVGESGSGKSITSLSILRLIQEPQGKIVEGQLLFQGQDLCGLSEKEMRHIRGNKIAYISQDPLTSLNPVLTVGTQIEEVVRLHQHKTKKEAHTIAIEMLRRVGIPTPELRVDEYPHQFSGGMRQRVVIAMALACEPDLLIADEPTTALDVTIQAQILDLMRDIQEKQDTAIIFITHDLGVVAELCDDVAVMYAGKIVEYADVNTLFAHPKHPYTLGLLASMPDLDGSKQRLTPIEGQPPALNKLPEGCSFKPRCKFSDERCTEMPKLSVLEDTHLSRCWKANEI